MACKLVFAQVVGAHAPTFLGQLDVHEGAIVARLGIHGGARDALTGNRAVAPVEGSLTTHAPREQTNQSEHHEQGHNPQEHGAGMSFLRVLATAHRLDPADQVKEETPKHGPDDRQEREDGDGRDDDSRLIQLECPLRPVIPAEETNEAPRWRHHAEQEEQGVRVPGPRLGDLRDRGGGATSIGVGVGGGCTHAVHASRMPGQARSRDPRRGRASPPATHTRTHASTLGPRRHTLCAGPGRLAPM